MESHPFRILRNLTRTREIITVLLNHGFGDLVDRIGLRDIWYRWLSLFRRQPRAPMRQFRTVERIRMTLESLGPTYIKFGQVMSTRPDLIPADMVAELERLQEQVPPFSTELAIAEIERELGAGLDELFHSFTREPLAAGSLAQVYRAVSRDGRQLAIKVRRPHAVRDVERDLGLMQELAALAERHLPEARIFDPIGLVNHFARSIRRELNFVREARSMDEFRRLFRQEPKLYVAEVFWNLTTEAVLTMEYIDGFRIDEPEVLRCAGIDPAAVANDGARLYMRQAFEFGVFHGDPHPGNVRVIPDGRICLLDYGMVGSLETPLREQLVDLFLAISRQDVDGALTAVLAIGECGRETDVALLQIDLRDFIGNYYGMELERLNVTRLLTDFVSILSTHAIRCPGSMLLLIRALVTLEGIGRKLDPQFNLATELQPFVERIVQDRYSPRRMADQLLRDGRRLLGALHGLPTGIQKVVERLGDDHLTVRLDHQGLDHLTVELERAGNRLVVGMVVASLILASALMIRGGEQALSLNIAINVLSSLLAVWLVYGIFRSGRL